MKTLFNPIHRKAIEDRVARLSSESRPLWGKMSVSHHHLSQFGV
jgi:hypothetical protein